MDIQKNWFSINKGWLTEHDASLDSTNTLVLFFAAPSFLNSKHVSDLEQIFPKSTIIGCSTSGEILDNVIYDESIVYTVIRFESSTVKLYLEADYLNKNIQECGEIAANKLYNCDLRHVLLFSSGFSVNIDEFVLGFQKNAGLTCTISGGLAGDGEDFNKTWVYCNGFHENAIICLGLSGEKLQIKQGCEGGWQKFGLERRITSSKRNILYTIDGIPALQSYKKYLGVLADKLPSSALLFPLAIRKNTQSSYVVRTILSVNEQDQSITFAGDIPEGWFSSFMRCTNEGLLDGAKHAAMQAVQSVVKPSLALFISCIGRRMVLGEACFQEVESALSVMQTKRVMNIGFYSYGEISEKPNINSKLHNQTMTITTISEGGNA